MAEWKLWEGEFPFTPEWYADRPTAPHLEQPIHFNRLDRARQLALGLIDSRGILSAVDLGCGDGGFLSLIEPFVVCWGYDLQPSNVIAARDRRMDVRQGDFLTDDIVWGQLAIITECLEHLEDPRGALTRIAEHADYLVASSPAFETDEVHDGLHAWAWDLDGYADLLADAGWMVIDHAVTEGDYGFQVVSAFRESM